MREVLRVSMQQLDLWMLGIEQPPTYVFLKAVDIITGQPTAAEPEALRRSMELWRRSAKVGQAAADARRTAGDVRAKAAASRKLSREMRARALEEAAMLMRSDAASMQILDAEKNELRLLAWKGFHPESAARWQRVSVGSESTCGAALKERQRVIVADVNDPTSGLTQEGIALYKRSGLVAVQSTPLVSHDGRLLGMFSTHWRRVHQPSERDLALFDVLARKAADALNVHT